MPLTSSDNPTADHLFLRTDTEHDHGAGQAGHELTTIVARDPWPMPDNAEEIVQRLNQYAHYAVLALRIDPPAAENPSDSLRATIETHLTQAAETTGGFWFVWGHDRYGFLLPDPNAAAARELAHQLQADVAKKMIETISIGISEFPLLEFDRPQSLVNALKALEHAAFFGADSCVQFDSVSLNISGDHYYQLHDIENAMREYRLALRVDEANITARNSLGVCLAESGDRAAALAEFDAARNRSPHDAMALFNIGLIHVLGNEPQSALAFFMHADEAAPETLEIVFQIGKLLTEQNQWQQALPYLETAQRLRPEWAAVFSLQGQCLEALGKNPEAVAAYKKAVKLNPNDAVALSSLGTLYADKGENIDICLTFSRQSVLIAPGNGLFHLRLGRLLQQDGQWQAALDEYEQAAVLGCVDESALEEVRACLQNPESEHRSSPTELQRPIDHRGQPAT
jgi:tetratricopeptide (TPR) repeat protein